MGEWIQKTMRESNMENVGVKVNECVSSQKKDKQNSVYKCALSLENLKGKSHSNIKGNRVRE